MGMSISSLSINGSLTQVCQILHVHWQRHSIRCRSKNARDVYASAAATDSYDGEPRLEEVITVKEHLRRKQYPANIDILSCTVWPLMAALCNIQDQVPPLYNKLIRVWTSSFSLTWPPGVVEACLGIQTPPYDLRRIFAKTYIIST